MLTMDVFGFRDIGGPRKSLLVGALQLIFTLFVRLVAKYASTFVGEDS